MCKTSKVEESPTGDWSQVLEHRSDPRGSGIWGGSGRGHGASRGRVCLAPSPAEEIAFLLNASPRVRRMWQSLGARSDFIAVGHHRERKYIFHDMYFTAVLLTSRGFLENEEQLTQYLDSKVEWRERVCRLSEKRNMCSRAVNCTFHSTSTGNQNTDWALHVSLWQWESRLLHLSTRILTFGTGKLGPIRVYVDFRTRVFYTLH